MRLVRLIMGSSGDARTVPPGGSHWGPLESRRRQRAFWDPAYEGTGDPMGGEASPMLRIALGHLPSAGEGQRLVELGCGTGRDLAEFIRRGFEVAAVDLSRPAVRTARLRSLEIGRRPGQARPIIDVGDSVEFLKTQPESSADVVYSNLFLTMGVPLRVERALAREIARVLRPGGLHIFSVRSREDQWWGRGPALGPSTFDLAPHGPPVRFFTKDELDRRSRSKYERVDSRTGIEGEGTYARTVIYVVDRRRSSRTARE